MIERVFPMRLPGPLATLRTDSGGQRPITLDGGLATQCEAMGYDISGNLWSAGLLRTDPDAIRRAHLAYLEAGAEIIISASYQVSRSGFRREGLPAADADHALAASVELAVSARDEFASSNTGRAPALVAASVGPYGATLHDGSEYTGAYEIDAGALRDFHRERLHILDRSGADLLACETIPSLAEAQVLRDLLQTTRTPAWVSFCCRDGGHISDGTSIETGAALYANHPGVFAIGVNCTAPIHVLSLIRRIRAAAPGLGIVVYPNSGETWNPASGLWQGPVEPDSLLAQAQAWRDAGASIIGGCCRIGPEEIALLKDVKSATV